MKLLLICTAMQSWFAYDLEKEVDFNSVSVEMNVVKSLTEYHQTVVRLDGKGKVKDGYVYVMDSPSFDTANKKFTMSLDCRTEQVKKRE
jgi:hypothetical protein